jgi:hypothetical protein
MPCLALHAIGRGPSIGLLVPVLSGTIVSFLGEFYAVKYTTRRQEPVNKKRKKCFFLSFIKKGYMQQRKYN